MHLSQPQATSARATQHVTDSGAASPTYPPTAAPTHRDGSLSTSVSAKSAFSKGNSSPLVAPTTAAYSSPTSHVPAAVPTRSSAMPLQNAKPSPAVASPVLAGSPSRATPVPVRSANNAASGSGARVPAVDPPAQQQVPAAKRPIAPLPLRGSGASRPSKAARPLTIRRSLD